MSEFKSKILDAKKIQQRFIFKVIISSISFLIILLILFFFLYSKRVLIKPYVNNYNLEFVNGKGVHFFKRILFLSDEVSIKVLSEGYEVYENILRKTEDNFITINLIKKKINLIFSTNSEIGQNNWFIDNKFISDKKKLTLKIRPGIYTLKVENKFYKTKSLDLNLLENTYNENYQINLERLEGKININTVPVGATLNVDGKEVGKSPLNYKLPAGNYEFKLFKKGYQPVSEKIEISGTNLNLKKKFILSPNSVRVNLNLKPNNGKLFINGNLYNQYDFINLLTKKKYKILYKKNGYIKKEKEFFFYENKFNEIKFLLEKEYGEVSIISEPNGNIKIDGKDFGNTPKKIKLQTYQQTLEIIKEGFAPFKMNIKPKPDQLSKVNVRLEKKIDKVKRLSPKSYTNSIGIEMKLFSPGNFTMGAPRHEKGQRANEFLKDIVLRKKFYSALTEVTIEQFMKFRGKGYKASNKNLPISNISWLEAVSFCNWLSEKESLEKVYIFDSKKYLGANLQNNGYRLPTEAEWEWLARKAGRNKQTKFSWGKNLPIPKMSGNLADESAIGFLELYIPNYKDNYRVLAPVGSFKKDIAGVYDLTGNVKEWVHDHYLVSVPKSNMVYYDPSGPKRGVGYVVKGSSYRSASLQEVRASYRDSEENKKDDIGFRIVRYLYGKEYKNDEE